MPGNIDIVRRLYRQFNARQIDDILASLARDVIWANGMEGGYVKGQEGVREYWMRQWATIDPHVEPIDLKEGGDGVVEVDVHQTVRDLEGNLLLDMMVGHRFHLVDGLVRQFDIR